MKINTKRIIILNNIRLVLDLLKYFDWFRQVYFLSGFSWSIRHCWAQFYFKIIGKMWLLELFIAKQLKLNTTITIAEFNNNMALSHGFIYPVLLDKDAQCLLTFSDRLSLSCHVSHIIVWVRSGWQADRRISIRQLADDTILFLKDASQLSISGLFLNINKYELMAIKLQYLICLQYQKSSNIFRYS